MFYEIESIYFYHLHSGIMLLIPLRWKHCKREKKTVAQYIKWRHYIPKLNVFELFKVKLTNHPCNADMV